MEQKQTYMREANQQFIIIIAMNNYTFLTIALIIQLTLASVIGLPETHSNKSLSTDLSKQSTTTPMIIQPKPVQALSNSNSTKLTKDDKIDKDQKETNTPILNYTYLPNESEGEGQNQTNSSTLIQKQKAHNVIRAPTKIHDTVNISNNINQTQDSNEKKSFLNIPFLNQKISECIWECTSNKTTNPQSNKSQVSKLKAYFPNDGNYTLKFNLTVASPYGIDQKTQVYITLLINNKSYPLNRVQGFYSQTFLFTASKGNIEISFKIEVQGKCQGFIYALLSNIEISQNK